MATRAAPGSSATASTRANWGLGMMASSLRPGVDCPQNCAVFDAVVADEAGEPRTIPRAVALYERDGGIAWKHADNTRRARELVLSFLSEAGNYEYGFDWVFHQDGTLEMRVALTGIMSVKGVADGGHSTLTATWWRRTSPPCITSISSRSGWTWTWTARRIAWWR